MRNFGGLGRSIKPPVSRALRSTMTPSGTAAGANTIHDKPDDAWRPPGRVPLQLDEDEQIAGKSSGRPRDLAAVRGPGSRRRGT